MKHLKTIGYCIVFFFISQVSLSQSTILKKGEKFQGNAWLIGVDPSNGGYTAMYGHQYVVGRPYKLYMKDFIRDQDPQCTSLIIERLVQQYKILFLELVFADQLGCVDYEKKWNVASAEVHNILDRNKFSMGFVGMFYYSEKNSSTINKLEAFKKDAPNSYIPSRMDHILLLDPNGKVLETDALNTWTKGKKQGSYCNDEHTIEGKLLTSTSIKNGAEPSNQKTRPLVNAEVTMRSIDSNRVVGYAKTDKSGDFKIVTKGYPADYNLSIVPQEENVEEIILLTTNGENVTTIKKTSKGFNYRLIPADVIRLSEMPEEDISSSFDSFKSSGKKEIIITEKILYASGQYQIDPKSLPTLDKVVQILKANPNTQLDVISHTDSNGDDNSNLVLSEKRASSVVNYLVSKGISKTRLNPVGKGETQIRNRCANGVECSDKEHEFNRRTEFYFVKK